MNPSVRRLVRRLVIASFLFISSFLIGTLGLMYWEQYSLSDAFYMAVITISTVGFGEVKPLSPEGKIFMSLFIIYNIFVLTFSLSSLGTYLFEGELKRILSSYHHSNKVKKMKNHIIVCGFGRYGRSVCQELSYDASHRFVVIDNNPDRVEAAEKEGYTCIEGSASEDSVLILAGIRSASTLICCLPKGSDNVYITLTARELNPHIRIIARSEEETDEKKLKIAGANYVIKPNLVSALLISRLVQSPEVVGFMQLMMGFSSQITLKSVDALKLRPQYRNKPLSELNFHSQTGVTVVGLYDKMQQNYMVNPSDNTLVHENLTLIIMGNAEQIEKFYKIYCE